MPPVPADGIGKHGVEPLRQIFDSRAQLPQANFFVFARKRHQRKVVQDDSNEVMRLSSPPTRRDDHDSCLAPSARRKDRTIAGCRDATARLRPDVTRPCSRLDDRRRLRFTGATQRRGRLRAGSRSRLRLGIAATYQESDENGHQCGCVTQLEVKVPRVLQAELPNFTGFPIPPWFSDGGNEGAKAAGESSRRQASRLSAANCAARRTVFRVIPVAELLRHEVGIDVLATAEPLVRSRGARGRPHCCSVSSPLLLGVNLAKGCGEDER
jgi:hypothetical protein